MDRSSYKPGFKPKRKLAFTNEEPLDKRYSGDRRSSYYENAPNKKYKIKEKQENRKQKVVFQDLRQKLDLIHEKKQQRRLRRIRKRNAVSRDWKKNMHVPCVENQGNPKRKVVFQDLRQKLDLMSKEKTQKKLQSICQGKIVPKDPKHNLDIMSELITAFQKLKIC